MKHFFSSKYLLVAQKGFIFRVRCFSRMQTYKERQEIIIWKDRQKIETESVTQGHKKRGRERKG